MASQEVVIPYAPRPLQAQLHEELKRFSVIVAHRRFGKTVFCINHAIRSAFTDGKENSRYGYVAPFRVQAKAVAWDYLKQFTAPIPGVQWNESELRCDLPNGARIQLFGADNYDAMRGLYLDGVILDEYAQMSPQAWEAVIRPALSDRKGWAIFIGTPMGRNQFHEVYEQAANEGWYRAMFKASDTGIIDEEELKSARRDMDPALFKQEFECSFTAAILGAVYGQHIEQAETDGRLCRVPYESGSPVHTAWDLGIGDSTAIWFFQTIGREIRVIDFYQSSGVGLEHYAGKLTERGYTYGEHILPHDAEVKELGSGRSRIETLAGFGLRGRVLPKTKIEDGINAARAILSRCYFDQDKCRDGLEALRQYRYEYDDKSRAFKPRPVHDWTSHAADAFRYLAQGLPEKKAKKRPEINLKWVV